MVPNRPDSEDFRRLARLAVPVALVQVGLMAMGVVDTMFVGRISSTALAGVAVGSLVVFALGTFGMGLLLAVEPVISQAIGAGDRVAISRAFQRGLALALVLGALSAVTLAPVGALLRACGQSEALIAVATPFVHVQMPSMVAFYLFVLFRQVLQAHGHTRPIVVTIVLANLLNAGLDWVLVFGHLGAPAMGTLGSGIATSISRGVMATLLLALSWSQLRPLFAWRSDALQWRPLLRLLLIGLPIAVQYVLEYGVFAAVALLMGRIGDVPLAAHQIAINIASLTFMVPLGVSSAGSVLVGRAVGAGDGPGARRAGLAAIVAGVAFMALSALVLLALPRLLARAYTPHAAVIDMAAALIPIAGVFQVFDGLQVVCIGVLRGTGDTRAPLVLNLVGYWVLAFPLGLWLGFRAGWGPAGLWWGLTVGLAAVGLALLARVRVRLWGPLERLRMEEHA